MNFDVLYHQVQLSTIDFSYKLRVKNDLLHIRVSICFFSFITFHTERTFGLTKMMSSFFLCPRFLQCDFGTVYWLFQHMIVMTIDKMLGVLFFFSPLLRILFCEQANQNEVKGEKKG